LIPGLDALPKLPASRSTVSSNRNTSSFNLQYDHQKM
jgi:hypothetical protein